MAEFNAFSIGIGADITVLQTELQRAKNLLAQFEAASKKALTVGELNYSNSQIANLKNVISQLNTEIGKTGKPIGDATQSLVNLSRVAQDAPYGFIGIANNINPLLESFQRLQKESGSTTKALGSIVSGIGGPAGLGLAVGVATSLLTVYSKEIAEFFKKPTEKLKEFREELKKTSEEVYKIVGEAQANRVVGLNLVTLITGGDITQQEEALKKLKALYSDNKAIQDAKIGNDKQFYINLVNLASKQEEFAGKEKNINTILDKLYAERNKIEQKRDIDVKNVKQEYGAGGVPVYDIDKLKERIRANAQVQLDEIDKSIIQAKSKQLEFITALTSIETPDKKGGKGIDILAERVKEEKIILADILANREAFIKKMKEIGLEPILQEKLSEKIAKDKQLLQETNKLLEPITEKMASQTGLGGLLAKDASKRDSENKIEEEDKKRKIKNLKDIQKAHEDFANSIANNVTSSIMGMWDAIQSGESVIDSLGNMLGRLAEQLVAAALQAAIFAGIMAIFSGGTSAVGGILSGGGAAGGLSTMFGSLIGLASGGVVSKPTLAMIGEGSESEAVLPLSKLSGMLNTTFKAGSMNAGTGGGNGQFVLRGQDLLLSVNRAQKASNLKGQTISLA